jgi:hypothetical protein
MPPAEALGAMCRRREEGVSAIIVTPMCTYYGGGAVYQEKNSWKGVCPFGGSVWSVVFPESDFLGDLVRFLIAYPLNTV